MSKPRIHTRDGGGHHLRGRRAAEKRRQYMTLPRKGKHWGSTPSGHVAIEKRLVLSVGDQL